MCRRPKGAKSRPASTASTKGTDSGTNDEFPELDDQTRANIESFLVSMLDKARCEGADVIRVVIDPDVCGVALAKDQNILLNYPFDRHHVGQLLRFLYERGCRPGDPRSEQVVELATSGIPRFVRCNLQRWPEGWSIAASMEVPALEKVLQGRWVREQIFDALGLPAPSTIDIRDDSTQVSWQPEPGLTCTVARFNGELPLLSEDEFAHMWREVSWSRREGAVEVSKLERTGLVLYRAISKEFIEEPPSMAYGGYLTVIAGGSIYRLTASSREQGITGTREAVLLAVRQAQAGHDPWDGWYLDPEEHAIAGPAAATLSDGTAYDAAFPEHPLSRIRVQMETWYAQISAVHSSHIPG